MKNVNAYKMSHFSSCTVSCRDFISPHMSVFSLMHPLLLQLSVCITTSRWGRQCITTSRILVPRALLTRGQPSATRGSGQIHIKLASDWPQRNIWFIVNMNKNTQALHEALVSLWRKLGEKTLLMLKEQQYEAVRKIVVDNRPQKR